jgi:hypothetical protein
MRKSKKQAVFKPVHIEIIASLKERIIELEGHLAGKSSNSILAEAEHLTTRDRNESYGHPAHDYGRVSAAFNALTGHDISTEEAILFMVCVKMAREAFKPKRDNRVDAAGYLNCLDMVIQARDQGLLSTGSQPSRPVAAGLQGAEVSEKARPVVPVGNFQP